MSQTKPPKTRPVPPAPPTPEEDRDRLAFAADLLARIDALALERETERLGHPPPPDWDGAVGSTPMDSPVFA